MVLTCGKSPEIGRIGRYFLLLYPLEWQQCTTWTQNYPYLIPTLGKRKKKNVRNIKLKLRSHLFFQLNIVRNIAASIWSASHFSRCWGPPRGRFGQCPDINRHPEVNCKAWTPQKKPVGPHLSPGLVTCREILRKATGQVKSSPRAYSQIAVVVHPFATHPHLGCCSWILIAKNHALRCQNHQPIRLLCSQNCWWLDPPLNPGISTIFSKCEVFNPSKSWVFHRIYPQKSSFFWKFHPSESQRSWTSKPPWLRTRVSSKSRTSLRASAPCGSWKTAESLGNDDHNS